MLEKTLRLVQLYDIYGVLLTKRQQEFFRLYFEEDLSLGEIAAEFNISRQAVHEILNRGEASLVKWEHGLNLVESSLQRKQIINEIFSLLKNLKKELTADGKGWALVTKIKLLLELLART